MSERIERMVKKKDERKIIENGKGEV